MKNKKLPLRKCLGCQELKDKRELIRVVKNKSEEVSIDLSGKANGRGAYICKNMSCFDKAHKKKAFERALKSNISEDLYVSMRKELEDAE